MGLWLSFLDLEKVQLLPDNYFLYFKGSVIGLYIIGLTLLENLGTVIIQNKLTSSGGLAEEVRNEKFLSYKNILY